MSHQLINPQSLFNSLQYGFSQAVVAQGTKQIFLSGQVAVNEAQETVEGGMEEQTLASLENIKTALAAAGATIEYITMLRIYIKEDANSYDAQLAISDALKTFFGNYAHASSWVVVTGLALPEWLIEIEAQAVIPDHP